MLIKKARRSADAGTGAYGFERSGLSVVFLFGFLLRFPAQDDGQDDEYCQDDAN
jgi:hypothetical protein